MYHDSPLETYSVQETCKMEAFAADYIRFLTAGKTEREVCALASAMSEKNGFRNLDDVIREKGHLQPGDKVYRAFYGKTYIGYIIGSEPMENGMNIVGAHIDSPRLDVKQNPLYEEGGLCYLDTHYYGGIKKYQWASVPLALHGVVCRKDGTHVTFTLGEKPEDPVFFISDLLIHLSKQLMSKPANEVMQAEDLNLIIGSYPEKGEKDNPVMKAITRLLKEEYQIEEADFVSAELEIVPAAPAREAGLDRSMICGYGHDDRSCAYPSLMALNDWQGIPTRTLCTILTDKEEIGSVGATGMRSRMFENTTAEVMAACGQESSLALRRCLERSLMLSSDVTAGFDPNFASAFEKKNSAMMGKGVCFSKFTGSGGKGGSNDANAEFISLLRRTMDDNGVNWQTSELGRVDVGGGGTIAYMCAKYCMQVIDCGVPVLSMHAPQELICKTDLWEAYKAYSAFFSIH